VHSRQVALVLGGRKLSDDFPDDGQSVLGLEFATGTGKPIGVELGVQGGATDEGDNASDGTVVLEAYGGVRKTFGTGSVRPVLGVGLAAIHAGVRTDLGASDDHDSSLAGYAHVGVGFMLSESISLGLDARGLFGSDLEILGADFDADYEQLTLVLAIGI